MKTWSFNLPDGTPKFSRRASCGVMVLLALGASVVWLLMSYLPADLVARLISGVAPVILFVFLLTAAFLVIRQFRDYTIRRKLTILFFVVSILPLGILTFINDLNSRAILINNANDGLSAAASLTANQLDAYITQKLNTVSSEAQLPDIVDYLDASIAAPVGSPEYAAMQEFIRALASQDPQAIRSISIVGVDGTILVDTNSSNLHENRSNTNYFQAVMATGLRYASSVEFSDPLEVPSIYFAAPVRDVSGAIIGILSKQYSDAVIQASITQNIGLAGDDSYPILFDKNHLRLADGSGPTRLYKTLVPLDATTAAALQEKHLLPFGSPLNFSSNLPDFEEKLNQIESQPFFAADLHDNDLDVEQVATATLKTQPWIVVFAQSQDVFLTPINVQARNNVLGMVVMSLMVAGFGFFVSQTVAGPIVRLTKAVESIHEGNLEQSAAVESQDEIGKLALAFNDMTLQLRGFINLLEQRVVERTAVAENARAESEAARRDLELQMWLATGQTQLMDVMRGEQTLPQLAGNVITQICQYTGAQAGAIFILKDKTLTLAGRYAYAERPGMEDGFQLGDGLVGQAAADGKVIYWDVIPPDALVISTGLVNIKPRQLAAAPFFMNEKVVGVLELATLSTFTPAHLELWNRISESLGTAFVTVQTRQRLAELLMESQQQAEELQAQEEELRAANEELQAQAENLKAIRPARAKR